MLRCIGWTFAAVFAFRIAAYADVDVRYIDLVKVHLFDQVATGAATSNRWEFQAYVTPDDQNQSRVTSATLVSPSNKILTRNPNGIFGYNQSFSSPAALDSAYPAGAFGFNIETATAPTTFAPTINFSSASYSNTPILSNTEFAGGSLRIDSSQDFYFKVNAMTVFPSQSLSNSRRLTILDAASGELVFELAVSSSSNLSLLPAGTLLPNVQYKSAYTFSSLINLSQDTGTDAVTSYQTTTISSIQTVPEPSSSFLLALTLAGWGIAGRRMWR